VTSLDSCRRINVVPVELSTKNATFTMKLDRIGTMRLKKTPYAASEVAAGFSLSN